MRKLFAMLTVVALATGMTACSDDDGTETPKDPTTTTFNRYKVQLNTLTRLQKELSDGDVLITKEYVKGRPNLVANPAIAEYNRTATAANQTVATLLKIITTFADGPVMNSSAAAGDDCDL